MKPSLPNLLKRCREILLAAACAVAAGCLTPDPAPLPDRTPLLPESFPGTAEMRQKEIPGWRDFFRDAALDELISTALTNNQEIQILLQEVAASRAEVGARKGALFPFVTLGGGAGAEKASRNTVQGAVENDVEIQPGTPNPEFLPNYAAAAEFEWEVDIWRRLRNERDAAVQRYLATREGRSFAVTHLVSELAASYYELVSLDALLGIVERMLEIQEQALESIRQKKAAGRVTELAVRRFEAEVLKNRGRLFQLRQRIVETENRINGLAGRYPQPVRRSSGGLDPAVLAPLQAGIPSDLLRNRPDVRKAELELIAAGLDVKAAGARFYPALSVSALVGLESFTFGSPIFAKENMVYGAAANLVGPLINRSAIRAAFQGASANQVAAVYRYQQSVLKAYVEVVNELSRIRNVEQEYELKLGQAEALTDSVTLSSSLFSAARADYTEVLLTQREALEARMELVELQWARLTAGINAYRALGGGAVETRAGRPAAPVVANTASTAPR
ncbi:MAG: efflux transporter outer membrane subunit [Verrucomicrobiae bacterium]|nr:efflux transporter outer membrane subunit [Verrucomicrobiae bacterium]